MYKVWFWNNIEWIYEKDHFSYPFSKRDKTGKLLEEYSVNIATLIYWIDWTNFSTSVSTINLKNTDFNNDVNFLKAWVDWLIINWLNDIDNQIKWFKKSVWIILWIWDCAPIIWWSKDWDLIFNLHWGYKWILWLDNDFKWLIYNFTEELKKSFTSPEKIILDIWPMAWANFELDKNYIEPLIINFLSNYKKLNLSNYYIDTIIKDWSQKWNINLRQLIIDVLKYHWFKNISYTNINTTDINNDWPSYRLFSNKLQEINNRLSATIRKRVS